jgi:hypothetical protein
MTPTDVEAAAARVIAALDAPFGVMDGGIASVAVSDMRALAEAVPALVQRVGELERERDEARTLVTEANNSLYGSQGYFHSLNGGPFDKYHLANGIEKLKAHARSEWRRAEALALAALPTPTTEPTEDAPLGDK